MRITVSFSTFDPFLNDAPSLCDLCESKPSVFHFERASSEETPERLPARGFCCAQCASQMLEGLQQTESTAWAEEEALVKAQGVDVSDFHDRRLATFGSLRRR